MDLKSYLSERRGRASALAVALGVTPVTVHQWAKGKPVPAERCPAIERVTCGAVTCEELRPDLAESWAYLRGTAAMKEDSAAPPRSQPSPLPASGQGANLACQGCEAASTGDPARTGAAVAAGEMKTDGEREAA